MYVMLLVVNSHVGATSHHHNHNNINIKSIVFLVMWLLVCSIYIMLLVVLAVVRFVQCGT